MYTIGNLFTMGPQILIRDEKALFAPEGLRCQGKALHMRTNALKVLNRTAGFACQSDAMIFRDHSCSMPMSDPIPGQHLRDGDYGELSRPPTAGWQRTEDPVMCDRQAASTSLPDRPHWRLGESSP
jgi:hypothetical protein